MIELPQAADQQSGSDQQDQRQRHLRDHQRLGKTVTQRSRLPIPPHTLQNRVQVKPSHPEGRSKSTEDSSQQRDTKSKSQNSYVGLEFERDSSSPVGKNS